MRLLILCVALLIAGVSLGRAAQLSAGEMRLTTESAVITALTDTRGNLYAKSPETRDLGAVHTLKGDLPAPDTRFTYDAPAREVTIEQAGQAEGGLHGVQWGIAGVPLDYSILVPGSSGIKLERNSPVSHMQFGYPLGWECQFVIVHGPKGGFWVWAEDAEGRYKNLQVWKRNGGWDLAFETQSLAPFAAQTSLRSVKWRLGLIGPDWTEATDKYRRWAAANYHLTGVGDQQPAWVKDIRTLVICGMELDRLDELAAAMDPKQTVLYVPGWRRDGYDRNYPDYTALPELAPFLARAHALGFRVMLHVNYFGCDPKNELYAQFEKLQVHDPFSHEALWWVWPPEQPDIKFAYINPASKAWRDLFVSRMKELCTRYPVDALHLDQTLCIWNDDAGLVDGMTMLEGNIAEHRELRAALPNVALSGEGLNEVTCRYEAFAQRHAMGINHTDGTWDRSRLAMSHPVSSMILRPFTVINGYLGMTSPANSQLYAAWRQAYVNWGVIPTFGWPQPGQLKAPQDFTRQLLDEIHFFQRERVDPDFAHPWPADAAFAYRTAAGNTAKYVVDNGWRFVAGKDEIVARTVTGAEEITGPGSIPGWLGYNDQRSFGLRADHWYPWVPEPRDPKAFHVADLPPGLELAAVTCTDEIARIMTRDRQEALWISDLVQGGRCGYTVFDGEGEEIDGPLNESKAGASFVPQGQDIWLHPPWKATRKNPQTGVLEAAGTGLVYCRMRVKLPADSQPRFTSEVYMDKGAVGEGKTDGVVFSVEATDGQQTRRAELHTAVVEPQPLELDLREFAGKDVTVKLAGDPGPQRSATFDWARWRAPRIVLSRHLTGTATIVSPSPWTAVLTPQGQAQPQTTGDTLRVASVFPGSIFLLNRPLQPVSLPCDLTGLQFIPTFVDANGTALTNPQYATAVVQDTTVGGVTKRGFFAHPPSHGQTRMDFPVTLPANVQRLTVSAGLRDGSKSQGCLFIVEATGQELARKLMLPGQWQELTADLKPFAGQAIVLSLVTDANGEFNFDWGGWGAPRLE